MVEEEWEIMNRAKKEDEEGEVTFIGGRRETVIDYVLEEIIGKERERE